jgi:hypothetical protein
MKLASISLNSTKVSDDGVKSLVHPRLEAMELENTAVTDDALKLLDGSAALRKVAISGNQITVPRVEQFAKDHPDCTVIYRGCNVSENLDFEVALGVDELEGTVRTMSSKGFFPSLVSMQAGCPELRFDAVFIRGVKPMTAVCKGRLSKTEGSSLFQEMKKSHRLMAQLFYQGLTEIKQLDIWRESTNPELWSSWSGDLSFIQQKLDEAPREGFCPTHLSGPSFETNRTFSCQFLQIPGAGRFWEVRFALAPARIQKLMAETKSRNWRAEHLNAYWDGTNVRFLAHLVENQQALDWDVEMGLSASEVKSRLAQKKNAGYRPQSIASFGRANSPQYVVVWVRYR